MKEWKQKEDELDEKNMKNGEKDENNKGKKKISDKKLIGLWML